MDATDPAKLVLLSEWACDHCDPKRQIQTGSGTHRTDAVFVEWDRKLMWVGTGTGIYLVTSPLLGAPDLQPMAVAE